jgi:nucleoside-diphosphate-sugar epimerase
MNVLVTGSSGFFGNIIVQQLEHPYIFTLNRNQGDYKCDLSVAFPEFNVNFDLVIHNSGKAHSVPKSESEKNAFFQINCEGTKNLLKSLITKAPKQFVFISSVAVYGIESGSNINETNSLNASDPYGLSKIQAEELVTDWCQENNVVCTILRLPLLVGQNPPGNLGSMLKAIKKGYYFNIDGGKAQKSMVLAEDVARFIQIISPIGGVYNLTDGEHPKFKDLSLVIAKKQMINLPLLAAKIVGKIGDLFGNSAPLNTMKIKKITSNLTFDDSKAREMGWKPQSVLRFLKHNDL